MRSQQWWRCVQLYINKTKPVHWWDIRYCRHPSWSSFCLKLSKFEKITKSNYNFTFPSSYRHLGPLLGLETVRELVLEDVRDDAPGDGHAGVELDHEGPPHGGVPERKPSPSLAAATLVTTRSAVLAVLLLVHFVFILYLHWTETPPPSSSTCRGLALCPQW